jgi:mono/diheme cytochrome c family protein
VRKPAIRWSAPILVAAGALALAAAAMGATAKPSAEKLARGERAYLAYCAMCHGDNGAGDGPLAAELTRQAAAVPLRLDDATRLQTLGPAGLRRVITLGGAHTQRSNMMPAWGERLGTPLIDDIATFIETLPGRRTEGIPAATLQKYLSAPKGSSEEGRRLFVYYCTGCHGPFGKGDGFNADTLRVRNKVRPRNLTDKVYLSTRTDQDLYAVIALGGGHMGKSSMMPAWTYSLQPGQIKSLIAYVRTISGTPSK